MSRRQRVWVAAAIAAALFGGWIVAQDDAGSAISRTIQQVFVTNFPAVQRVDGRVELQGPILQARMMRVEDVTVVPVRPSETGRLISGGTLVVDGHPGIVLSVVVQTNAAVGKAGKVGALLVPDEPALQRAFDEQGAVLFGLEVAADVPVGNRVYLTSSQPAYRLGFPRYKVYFYNTTDRTAVCTLYAYLTN